MPLFVARRRCPQAAVVSMDRVFEDAIRARVSRALDRWTPRASVRGCLRCSLDLSGTPAQR